MLTGIIGYFYAILLLKDSISENKTEIFVAKKEIEYIKEEIKKMDGDVAKIPSIKTDIAVLQAKVEIADAHNKK